MPSAILEEAQRRQVVAQRTKASCKRGLLNRSQRSCRDVAVPRMIGTAAIYAITILSSVKVYGFNIHDTINSVPAVDGLYPGRFVPDGIGISGQAVFSQGGISGNVLFVQEKPGAPVKIHVNLMGLDQYSDAYRWSIREFPVRTSLLRDFPCAEESIGGVYNPANVNLACTNTADSVCPTGDLTTKLGPIVFNMPWQVFEDPSLILTGPDSILGRSVVIDREDGPEGAFICANIEQLGVRRETLRAAFDNSAIQGDVIVRFSTGRDDAKLEADLHRLDGGSSTGIMGFLHSSINNTCEGLEEAVYGSFSYPDAGFTCDRNNQRGCIIGDISSKCGGPLPVENGRSHRLCTDSQIGSIPREDLFDVRHPERALFMVIRDDAGAMLGCAQLALVDPLQGRAQFRSLTTFGDFLFWQNGPDDRTYVRAHLTGLRGTDYSLRIFTNKLEMGEPCNPDTLGDVVSKQGGEFILPGNTPTNDGGSIGNLDALLQLVDGQQSLRTTVSSAFLPLFGPYSVLDRTLGLVNEETGVIEACGTIMRQAEYPLGEFASLSGYQDINNPPLPEVMNLYHAT